MKPRDETKARDILAATLLEVEAVGLAGLSMEAVARRAKVATGTLYIYFKNKEALVDALYLASKRALSELVFKDEGLPVRAAFRKMCLGYLDYLVEHRAAVVFMAQVSNSPYLSEASKTEGVALTKALTSLLERGKRELLLKDLDAPFMIAFLHGTLRELAALAAREGKAQRKKRFEQAAVLCWDALKA